ncbi:MAG: type I glyceraldehyde-3-phosphate dehydrogenase [Patescibacteria group bacterium]|nr:type I glyceraldehyde-3-phosphate dehydrogenase [Patescibacteria group bacterium]
MTKLAINGFGRIGRAAFAAAIGLFGSGNRRRKSKRFNADDFEVVAVNDLGNKKQLVNLLKYDSVYGVFGSEVSLSEDSNYLIVDGKKVRFCSEKSPADLPWEELGVDVVLECTGVFADFEEAAMHIDAGAKKVIISTNAKGDGPTVVLGTDSANNLGALAKEYNVFSNASCTTNCISPIMQILEDSFGVEKALMTTEHAYTSTQNLVDGPHRKDPRRARAAGVNSIPTTTGSAKATGKVVPKLNGKFDGIAIRVPVPCGSISDVVAVVKKSVSVDEINSAFKEAVDLDEYKGIIDYSEAPLVSTDIIGDPHSAVFDAPFTRVVGGDLVKILAWYDNEWAYANRLVEVAQLVMNDLG